MKKIFRKKSYYLIARWPCSDRRHTIYSLLKPKASSKFILLQHGYPNSAKRLEIHNHSSFHVFYHHNPHSTRSITALSSSTSSSARQPSISHGPGRDRRSTSPTRSHTSTHLPSFAPSSHLNTQPPQTGGSSPPFDCVAAGVSAPLACCWPALDFDSVRPKLIVLPALNQFLRFPNPMLL